MRRTAAIPFVGVAQSHQFVCTTRSAKISFAEGKCCWNNEARFGGLQYCREHQEAAFK